MINYARNHSLAEKAKEEIISLGRRAIAVRADVGKVEAIESLFQAIKNEFGKLDIFIHNAAVGANKPGMQQQPGSWDTPMKTNARGFSSPHNALPHYGKMQWGSVACHHQSRFAAGAAGLHFSWRQYPLSKFWGATWQWNWPADSLSTHFTRHGAHRCCHISRPCHTRALLRRHRRHPAGRLVTPKDIAELRVSLFPSS